jgi:hypothetical protein
VFEVATLVLADEAVMVTGSLIAYQKYFLAVFLALLYSSSQFE